MKSAIVSFNDIKSQLRCDTKYFVDSGSKDFAKLIRSKTNIQNLGEIVGENSIWKPPRFSQVHCQDPQYGKPYIAPWNTLRYIPRYNSYLSRTQNEHFESCEVKRGWFLITCSGRNLGPSVMVDKTLSSFAISPDMIRINTASTKELFYAMGYLHTSLGQYSLRRTRSGSVIDHISPKSLRELPIPIANDDIFNYISNAFKDAYLLRESARSGILELEKDFLRILGLGYITSTIRSVEERCFINKKSHILNRIDAEPYSPLYEDYRGLIKETGCGFQLNELATVHKPPGRYKTLYVKEAVHGLPLLSGRNMAQYRPVGLKYMSHNAFKELSQYLLKKGTVLLTCDGRAGDNLADCALIARDRDHWIASGHIIRLLSRRNTNPGLLYLAVSSCLVQAKLKSMATGSVIDALNVPDVEKIVVPYPTSDKAEAIGNRIMSLWNDFAEAKYIEDDAIGILESWLSKQIGDHSQILTGLNP